MKRQKPPKYDIAVFSFLKKNQLQISYMRSIDP